MKNVSLVALISFHTTKNPAGLIQHQLPQYQTGIQEVFRSLHFLWGWSFKLKSFLITNLKNKTSESWEFYFVDLMELDTYWSIEYLHRYDLIVLNLFNESRLVPFGTRPTSCLQVPHAGGALCWQRTIRWPSPGLSPRPGLCTNRKHVSPEEWVMIKMLLK